jgi:hypothetical protein
MKFIMTIDESFDSADYNSNAMSELTEYLFSISTLTRGSIDNIIKSRRSKGVTEVDIRLDLVNETIVDTIIFGMNQYIRSILYNQSVKNIVYDSDNNYPITFSRYRMLPGRYRAECDKKTFFYDVFFFEEENTFFCKEVNGSNILFKVDLEKARTWVRLRDRD